MPLDVDEVVLERHLIVRNAPVVAQHVVRGGTTLIHLCVREAAAREVQRVVGGEGDQIRNGRVGDERFLDLERRHLLPRPAAPQPKGICLWQNRSGNVHRPKP